MTRKLLDCIEIRTAEHCDYSVIWLHGLGASGHDFEPLVPELHLLQRPGVRFLFPHAPVRPITVNGGAAMRAWYDIGSIDFEEREQDGVGIRDSAEAIGALIDNEISRGVPASRITLAGFSQGGAIALYTGLTSAHRLGGILALSSYLPLQSDVMEAIGARQAAAEAAADGSSGDSADDGSTKGPTDAPVPVFMAHGLADEVVQLRYGEQSRAALEASGVPLEWHTYPISHSVSAEEVEDISAWLKRQFGM